MSPQRESVPELDAILGREWKVLDDGFVRVVDYLGSDSAIVQAARVSYGKGTKSVHEDEGLIRYLMRHSHTSPFEMCEIKLHLRVPMDAWRQWIRHRTASVNEYSTRYSEAIDSSLRTAATEWRSQSSANKQGSENRIDPDKGKMLSDREAEFLAASRDVYEERLRLGVAREQARKDLPLSTYTEAFWKIDLHNLFGFLRLRRAPEAQQEIRTFAQVIGDEIVKRWCPMAWNAFEDYSLNALRLSSREQALIRALACGDDAAARRLAVSYAWIAENENVPRNRREGSEAGKTCRDLGFSVTWL